MERIIEKIADVQNERSTVKAILRLVAAITLSWGWVCLQACLVMVLWNWAIVGLFGAFTINFWVALGLYLLCSVLLKLLFKNRTNTKSN